MGFLKNKSRAEGWREIAVWVGRCGLGEGPTELGGREVGGREEMGGPGAGVGVTNRKCGFRKKSENSRQQKQTDGVGKPSVLLWEGPPRGGSLEARCWLLLGKD